MVTDEAIDFDLTRAEDERDAFYAHLAGGAERDPEDQR